MSNNLGGGVSRVLDPIGTEFVEVIWQQGRPPCDAELNLLQELSVNYTRKAVLRGTPSGWLGQETDLAEVFQTNASWSNWFKYGRQRVGEQKSFLWANVNGWVIPVGGTKTGTPPGSPDDSDTFNVITLDPPPSNSGDHRIDFVFLEAWMARVPPNPSSLNKPSSSTVYRYGNVEGGFSYLTDDLVDPALGVETTQRVQLQYRIRVVKGLVGFTSYPDGFDPVTVKAQGAAAAPTSFTFDNMRATLGDPGLWRAGDGTTNTLGTVDGYVYAIPVCALFRRNSVAWNGDPSQNLNGAFNRNPTAVDRTGYKTFSTIATLASDLSSTALTATLVSVSNIPLPLTPSTPVYIQIGDEILTYSVITGTTITLGSRSTPVCGTRAEYHKAGSVVRVLSGRPDGLFADQVSFTDILDLRHAVNPNGFDYNTLLQNNFSKLLKGQLRANWKRTGAGPQGPFVTYEDKVTIGGSALGITKLDGPDNIRQVYSDAACTQKLYAIVQPPAATGPCNVAWSLNLNVNQTTQSVSNQFIAGDVLEIPVSQLKVGLPGGDADQVRWFNDATIGAVEIRIDGQSNPLPPVYYTVTPTDPTSVDDLVITFVDPGTGFPLITNNDRVIITLHVMYGPGRGVSRRPDAIHSVSYVSASTELLTQLSGFPASNIPTRVATPLLWSKFRSTTYGTYLPSTAETYVDPSSKTLVLNPLRRIDMPDSIRVCEGNSVNTVDTPYALGSNGSSPGASQLDDLVVDFNATATVGDTVVVQTLSGDVFGHYTIIGKALHSLTLDRPLVAWATANLVWLLYKGQGLMPLLKRDNTTPKWVGTDPLGMFSGTTDSTAATKNLYVTLPRYLVPSWGEYRVPILWQNTALFAEGVNYMFNVPQGAAPASSNYIPYSNGGMTFAVFSTGNLTSLPTPIPYNTALAGGGYDYAGMRKFTDTRVLGRKGLELPPFYGIARLWSVYEAQDFLTNGSGYNPSTRAPTGSATAAKNLLRQNFDGPLFWVEMDDDGDSTFILNADALDLDKSTNFPITSFDSSSTHFVVEASIFGFDRDAFDVTKECRIVLSNQRTQASSGTRANNYGYGSDAVIDGPVCILPGPPTGTDNILIDFSRTPYQGDAWGSQTVYQDLAYDAGPLLSGTAYQLGSTSVDLTALTRPYQKPLEVLSSLSFVTTLGTGRLLGAESTALDIFNVGFEDMSVWPPPSAIATRPVTLLGALDSNNGKPIGTEYLGCTERLPLGALWRDKDFKGQRFNDKSVLPLVITQSKEAGMQLSLATSSNLEVSQFVSVNTVSSSVGSPGDILVHVDGEQGNYSLLTNFRTARGGSLFNGGGAFPGGEVGSYTGTYTAYALDPRTNMLAGMAFLVRNTVTSVGATEVSAGDELMLLVLTSVFNDDTGRTGEPIPCFIGTNGTYEGWSAADLYRIEGRPLVNDHVRYDIDPSSISLTPILYRRP